MKLYDMELSGNSYKIRLLLSLLGLDYERQNVDTTRDETSSEEFKHINPRGQIPVLDDEGHVIWDSMAILCYLARKLDSELLPTDALAMARVMQWLAVSENELLYGLARARAVKRFGRPFDLEGCQAMARVGLQTMQQQLQQQAWLAGSAVTLADIACYPYVALAHEGEIDLKDYPAIQAWIRRIRQLPGYIAMPGMEATPLD